MPISRRVPSLLLRSPLPPFRGWLRSASTQELDSSEDVLFGGAKREGRSLVRAEALLKKWRSFHRPTLVCGSRAYYLVGSGAEFESALLDYALEHVTSNSIPFQWLDVADILPLETTLACGVQPSRDEHTHQMQYLVDNAPGHCLSGTAEMGIAGLLRGRVYAERELPVYYLAQSRCYRPEIATGNLNSGLYRVHEFNKLELFVVCSERQSDEVLARIVGLQKEVFAGLGLHCRLRKMPANDLGAAASVKFDIEAWMPGRRKWGEMSSASSCTDYQSRRLNIRYTPAEGGGEPKFVSTCNGTVLASTRAMIAVMETHQTRNRAVETPEAFAKWLPSKRSLHPRLRPTPGCLIGEEEDEGEEAANGDA